MQELVGWVLFLVAISGPVGFGMVSALVNMVRWFDMTILGMDYQTFWLIFVVMVGVLSVGGLLILSSISSVLRGIHDELKKSNQRMKYPDDDLMDIRVR